jgi:photosystem II stability/assembly factor-like uncharacterized protein
VLVSTLAVTRGFGAWGVTTTNAPSTATSDLIIVPAVTTTHPSHTAGTVNLSWTEPTTWVQGYDILRATTPTGTYTQIGSVSGAATTTYSDTTAVYNTQYYYEVAPYYNQWNPASAVAMALSLPPTAGTDATKSPAVTLTSANLTSMSTTSGGGYTTAANWSTQHLFNNNTAEAVSFPSAGTGWVVDNKGEIFQSSDGGQTWNAQTSPTTSQLNDVSFVDASNGWAVGNAGTVVHTSNGGSLWAAQVSGSTNNLQAVRFVDANNGWSADNHGAILHTANGGTLWSAQTSGTTNALNALSFADANNGWAGGNSGTILHTSNGGSTWTAQTSATTAQLNSMSFADISNGWAVGNGGAIEHTTNGGSTWAIQTSGTTQNLQAVRFVDASNGWAVGASGTILHTTNGGSTWAAQTSGTTAGLNGLAATDANHAWTVAAGLAEVTSDAGVDWVPPTTQYLAFSFSPTFASGAAVSSCNVTFEYKAGATPSNTTQTYLLVMPGNATSWSIFDLPDPTTSYQTVTTDLSSLISSQAALSGVQIRFVIAQSNGFATTTELVHVDVN